MPAATFQAIEDAQSELNHYLATLFTEPDADGTQQTQARDKEDRAAAARNMAGSVQKLVGTIIKAMAQLDERLRKLETAQ